LTIGFWQVLMCRTFLNIMGADSRNILCLTFLNSRFTAHRLPITDYRLPITDYRLPITNCQLPITNYQLPITNYQLPLLHFY